jgi:hypothetical protein
MKKVVFVAIFLVLVLVVIAPAGATPPEDISITVKTHFFFPNFFNPTGSWSSEGLIESNGDLDGVPVHFGAGWPPGVGFQTAHLIGVLSDENGTITISSQTHGYEFDFDYDEPYGDDDDRYDERVEGTGHWVILSGTGEYANLHGTGTVNVIGEVDWDALIMDTEEEYVGLTHFDP